MKALIYPKDSNPYQKLLYRDIPEDLEITYLTDIFPSNLINVAYLPIQLFCFRLCGYKLLHLHWVYTFRMRDSRSKFHTLPFRLVMTGFFYFFLLCVKLLRMKLVWTIHDMLPHGNYFVDNKGVMRVLSKFADIKIVHSKHAQTEMHSFSLDTSHTQIIPIGNYIGLYENNVTNAEARNKLKIKSSTFVFGMLGKIELYKGVLECIEAFTDIALENSLLIIAGHCPDPTLRSEIESAARGRKDIQLYLHFIDDSEIQYYMNSFDVLVYPFQNITTSSSVLLSMSFRKAVICPRMGDINDFPAKTGFYYETGKLKSLIRMMRLSYGDRKRTHAVGERGFEFIQNITWKNSAASTYSLYRSLCRV